jgi:arabinan endo-1,5-alpha-L-arabinosidase
MFYHDGYYYLFASFDQCCAGIRSTSTIRVGRSAQVTGPFIDKAGTLLLEGGGSPYISGDETFRAVGGSSFFSLGGAWYAAYHAYDASSAGQATLRIAPVMFDQQRWPVAHAP